ncbi:MAG TPA: response regulator [Candidatus Dormibacteraeota bacterium]|nr:response regulator [Candidatus Dormibacteraeota bacterium]
MATSRHTVDDHIRVLFVENDPAVAEMYKLKLELDGYDVTIVPLGEEVTQRANEIAPDLVFLDTQRHEDGGIATLRALRTASATEHVPVIILSSQHADELAASGFKADVMDYFVHADITLSSLSRNIDEWAATVASAGSRP